MTALLRSVSVTVVGLYSMDAVSVPRLICALVTPPSFLSDFSMVCAQVAQVIPAILSSVFFCSFVV